jgi:hypothetical protein
MPFVNEDIGILGVAYPLQTLAQYCPKSQHPYPCSTGTTAVAVSDVKVTQVGGFGRTSSVGDFDCGDVVSCARLIWKTCRSRGHQGSRRPSSGATTAAATRRTQRRRRSLETRGSSFDQRVYLRPNGVGVSHAREITSERHPMGRFNCTSRT